MPSCASSSICSARRPGGGASWCWCSAAITAVMGVLYALMQHDLKRLLAYHTVENIGIIFIGAWPRARLPGERNAGCRGARRSPPRCSTCSTIPSSRVCCSSASARFWTRDRRARHGAPRRAHPPHAADGVRVLVGCVAISALPPLNGFVSEWLTFQAILLSPALPHGASNSVPAVGALLALVGRARRGLFRQGLRHQLSSAVRARRPPRKRRRPIAFARRDVVLAALCLLAGILPGLFIDALAPVVAARSPAPACRAGRARLAHDRADRREPQLVQRPSGVRVHRRVGARCRVAIHRLASRQGAARSAPGTAASPNRARRRSTPRRASRSRSAACSARSSSVRARSVDMPPPGATAPARSPSSCATWSGTCSTRRSRGTSAAPPSG